MFAKLILNSSGEKLYLPVTRKDELAYERCSEELRQSKLPLPTLELKDGYNTRQVLNYAYRSWREFFNDRQLLARCWLHAALLDPALEPAGLVAFELEEIVDEDVAVIACDSVGV